MKTKLALLLAAFLLLPGCDWLKKQVDITIDTDLTLDIPVTVSGTKSADLTADIAAWNFSQTAVLDLSDNPDIADYVDQIKKVDLNSLVITVNGLLPGQTVNTMSLIVNGVGTICTQTNITYDSNSFTPAVEQSKLDQVANKLKTDKAITCTVDGVVSGPMSFGVHLSFDASIIANP
jgi:hypothetical protein